MALPVRVKFHLALSVLVGLCIWWAIAKGPLRDPEKALHDFYAADGRAEDQLMDPLILNGRRVVPLVIAALPNRDMHLRRYAIGFLGVGRHQDALPSLERILSDESELAYFRADALEAIYQIEPERARALAHIYMNDQSFLGEIARVISEGKNPTYRTRSYWQALWSIHE